MNQMPSEDLNYVGQQLSSFLSLSASILSIKANVMEYQAVRENRSLLPMLTLLLKATYLLLISDLISLALTRYEYERMVQEEEGNPILLKANQSLTQANLVSIASNCMLIHSLHLYIEAEGKKDETTQPLAPT